MLNFFIILVSNSVSSLLSENLIDSLKSSFFILDLVSVIILNYLFKENKSFEKKFVKIGFLSVLIVLISCLVEFLLIRYEYIKQIYNIFISTDAVNFKIQSTNLINKIDNRISGIFGSEGVAGSYVLRLSPFFYIFYLISIYRSEKKPTTKKIIYFNFIFILMSLTVLFFEKEFKCFVLYCFSLILNFLIIKRLREYLKYSIYSSII